MNYIKEKILDKAISLEQLGIRDLAWKKDDAKALISALMQENIGILGGDVYKEVSGKFIPLYDNWSSSLKYNETKESFYLRSKIESLEYIEKYLVETNEKIIFSLVFTEEMD